MANCSRMYKGKKVIHHSYGGYSIVLTFTWNDRGSSKLGFAEQGFTIRMRTLLQNASIAFLNKMEVVHYVLTM